MLNYAIIAFIIGLISITIGIVLKNKEKDSLVNFSILFLIISFFVLTDRLLLAKYGLGLWKYDSELHFVHRPNTIYSWGKEYGDKLIKINSLGFHDDEFVLIKKDGEKRIFFLGNSITMGHGVLKNETFANQLELLFDNYFVNSLNFGVQGYSTMQELVVLKRNISLGPDIIIDGFCLNDITEPIYVNKDFGGKGYDYHQIYQISNDILGYVINETGFGRFISNMKFSKEIMDAKKVELESVKSLALNPFYNDDVSKSWMRNLKSIEDMKTISDSLKSGFIVLIFPFTFQLFNNDAQLPQEYLKSFLNDKSIVYIDLLEIFERKINNDIYNGVRQDSSLKKYFLDEDHFTPLGHKIVASEIKKIVEDNFKIYLVNGK